MRFLHFCFGGFLIAACGGASSTGLGDGGTTSDGGNDATTTNDAATTTDAPNPSDVATKPDTGLACPDESGAYSVKVEGLGCGDTSSSPTECIQQTSCTIQLDFGGGSGKALKGTTPIQNDGSFANATIEEGSGTRTGCTGTWNAQTSTLVVDCGGLGSTQSCVATLVRTSATCP